MDQQTKDKTLRRLRIIKGQVEGLERMIAEGKYCLDVLVQISAIHEALRGAGRVVVENHLRTCITEGLRSDQPQRSYDELMDMIYKLSK